MKSIRLACLCLSCWLLPLSLGLADCNCGKCCKPRTSRGLLDAMDHAFDGFVARTQKDFKRNTRNCGCEARPSCGCEAAPSCGCEAAPSCGCEAAPSCGCEPGPGCGCEVEASCGCELRPTGDISYPSSTSRFAPAPVVTPQQQVWPVAPAQPPVQQHMAPRPRPPQTQVPAPIPVPSLPDEKVDPFLDDAVNRVRKPPARTIQYRRERPSFGERYDPQARREGGRSTAIEEPTNSRIRPDTRLKAHTLVGGFAAVSSSRNPHPSVSAEPQSIPTVYSFRDTGVVPASGSLPLPVNSTSAKRLNETQPPQVVNPLRQ